MVGGAVLVRAPPPWWGVLRWCVAPLLVGSAVLLRGAWCGGVVVACWVAVAVLLFAWPGLVLYWCVPPPPLFGRAVLVRAPTHGGACCVGVSPSSPVVGRAALVCGPPHGGVCCVGAWLPSRWGVLFWCLSAAVVVCGLVVFGLGCRLLFGGL